MTIYRPEPDSVFTVRELIDILKKADPDALIVTGTGLNDCENYIERVVINKAIVGFFTEAEEEDEDDEEV